jgi:hypothetical protein
MIISEGINWYFTKNKTPKYGQFDVSDITPPTPDLILRRFLSPSERSGPSQRSST